MILVHNDLTKDPTSRNFVHIEVHTQLHSATRVVQLHVKSICSDPKTFLRYTILENMTIFKFPVSERKERSLNSYKVKFHSPHLKPALDFRTCVKVRKRSYMYYFLRVLIHVFVLSSNLED